jgi:N-acetylglutamate synthase-like GNAT family acetyltransferase
VAKVIRDHRAGNDKEEIAAPQSFGKSRMDIPSLTNAASCLPRRFCSRNGLDCEMQLLPTDAGQRLVDMYLAFQPRNCFQGLPPLKDAVCIKWVQDMLRTGINVIAARTGPKKQDHRGQQGSVSSQNTIVGHTALFPINPRKCEMLVVVCPGFQNVGIGTNLVQCCIDLADELSFERIWLPVDATNVRARHVYRKCGFEYTPNSQGREMDMACNVRQHRSARVIAPPMTLPHFCAGGETTRLLH